MDYEDEMQCYDSDEYENNDAEEDYDDEDGFWREDDDDEISKTHSYNVLSDSDIKDRQEDVMSKITSVTSLLSLSKAASTLLLLHHNWNYDAFAKAWFEDEDKVREAVGLLPASAPVLVDESRNKSGKVKCRICLEACASQKMKSAGCGHLFCCECWGSYIGISIADSPGCLKLRCPDPACRVAIDGDMIETFCSDEQKSKYSYYLLRSYIEASKDTKWCPAPGCEKAISYSGNDGNYDVRCDCKYTFCWNCTEESHRPVECKTVREWILKNSNESENTNWILANSKPCPKCKRSIEKNQGCMHMVCSEPCKFSFCWLCLGPWTEHGQATGGYYACNKYTKAKAEGAYSEEETRREMAKNSVEKYTHYYERWRSNESSRKKALEDLHQMQTVNLDKVRANQCTGQMQVEFLVKAWEQIVECRRVLKWTYAYGYYLPDHDTAKKQFFEYLQGEAENSLERLHQCAEKEVQPFLEDDDDDDDDDGAIGPSQAFIDFKLKLAGLTAVTKTYFENLTRALENGLSDVDSTASKRELDKELELV